MVISNLIRDVQNTKDQIGPSDTQTLVFKKFSESVTILPTTYKIVGTELGNAFTVGHATNGIIGTANGLGGGQITIGTGGLGTVTTHRIFHDSNKYAEMLRTTNYTNTGNTTCTVDTSLFKLTFSGTQRYESSSIVKGMGTINNAQIAIKDGQLSDVAEFTFEMSADGGSNWESVTRNSLHTFTNTGTDLRFAIIGTTGQTCYVRLTSGQDCPIFITYNE